MTITDSVIQRIIRRHFRGDDYPIEIVNIIDAEFLQYVISFFQKVVEAKLRNQSLTSDWYRTEFLNQNLPFDDLIIHSGLNKKTITNMYNSARRNIVLQATTEHYNELYEMISSLVEQDSAIDIILTIKFNNVSVDLNINESLIVINTLAVKQAELRGGAWSSVGKQVEKILMRSLCLLYDVPSSNFDLTGLTESKREVDFYLIDKNNQTYQCEVKLMGQGNPESADAVYARNAQVFIADKLSDLNKQQLDDNSIQWVELRGEMGYRKFRDILQLLDIPYRDFTVDIDQKLDEILSAIFSTTSSYSHFN
ncbi:MAG: CfrBI family restriction endonuclease [Microcystis wesenbergii Mw_QC_B_20070930_S4]|nr:CfrBI family restriction endonuclease [Microcystis aeruginosa W11-03]NCR95278.1 CfrBI family restriction endonuclease [Microcystis aeruginosa W11-06]TRU98326.1 MAG: CfrBI family restriction endonuclease [Microcystis wesenbergii Mw_QC_B_20070930_S4D]TRV11245.1 MAG: CfrBI family restriction endonuclease [Microcystis wesenbergii Mw_QC_B_20070930_S4]